MASWRRGAGALTVGLLTLVEKGAKVQAESAHSSWLSPEPGPMGALDPVREPRGPAGPRGPLVPVRPDLLVPVGGTNRDQWATLLAHHPLVPVHTTNRD